MAGKSHRGGTDKVHPSGKARHVSQLKPGKGQRHVAAHGTDANTPLTEIRQKIRALEKLLAYDTAKSQAEQDGHNRFIAKSMPSHIRQEKERALAGHKHDLQLALEKKTKTQQHSKMISKYHHIRFFERKKAERRLRKAKTALEQGKVSEETVLKARNDLNYTLYLPLEEKYVSLWPQNGKNDPHGVRDGDSWKRLAAVWAESLANNQTEQEVEREMLKIRDNGWPSKLEVSTGTLQNRTEHVQSSKATIPRLSKKDKKSSKALSSRTTSGEDRPQHETRKANRESDSDSDGFFEK